MTDDDDYGAPQASGSGGGLNLSNPYVKYGLLVAGLLVGYFAYKRFAGGGSSAGGGLTAVDQATPNIDPNTGLPTQSFAVNPVSGLPINPATGQDFSQIGSASNDLSVWLTKAYNSLVGLGVSPTAADQALYDLTQGNPLTTSEQSIIDKAQGAAGMPPGGTYPTGNVGPPPPPTTVIKTVTTPLSAIQQYVNGVYAYLHRNTKTYKGPTYSAAQIALAEKDVTSGKAALPGGFTAPKGYVLNPTTRILTKAS